MRIWGVGILRRVRVGIDLQWEEGTEDSRRWKTVSIVHAKSDHRLRLHDAHILFADESIEFLREHKRKRSAFYCSTFTNSFVHVHPVSTENMTQLTPQSPATVSNSLPTPNTSSNLRLRTLVEDMSSSNACIEQISGTTADQFWVAAYRRADARTLYPPRIYPPLVLPSPSQKNFAPDRFPPALHHSFRKHATRCSSMRRPVRRGCGSQR